MIDSNKSKEFEERLIKFSKETIELCQSMNISLINKSIISQLVRSATSIGANYCEANNASSKKDFSNKIFICKKESQETYYWLKLLKATEKNCHDPGLIDKLSDECHQFNLIFQKIVNTMKNKKMENK